MNTIKQEVLFGEQRFGHCTAGIIELSRPAALNALNEDMLQKIADRLQRWQTDDSVQFIFIHSENQKAFCAGGDVKALAQAGLQKSSLDAATSFFTQEYFTDCLMHFYRKPIVAWLNGLCMGGGLGLTRGASFRITTDWTLMAMPEVFIGFFADVGATRFLSGLGALGLYLGLTGYRFSGPQAVEWGIATHFASKDDKGRVLADLLRLPLGRNNDENRQQIARYLDVYRAPKAERPNDFMSIEKVIEKGDFENIARQLEVQRQQDRDATRRPSLLSQAAFLRLARINQNKPWPEVFTQEWTTAINFCKHGEFTEGVRALLIDKEPEARWPQRSYAEAWAESEQLIAPCEPNLLRDRVEQFK